MTFEAQVLEVHRLAVAGGEAGIARSIGDPLARGWLARFRFAEVITLAESTLTLGDHAGALYRLEWALRAIGRARESLGVYEQALELCRAVGARGNEAATLNNIGGLHDGLGDRALALRYYESALPIRRGVGNRVGEAVTRFNIALVYRAEGDLVRAVAELELVVEMDRQVGHPDLDADTALLDQLRQELHGLRPVE